MGQTLGRPYAAVLYLRRDLYPTVTEDEAHSREATCLKQTVREPNLKTALYSLVPSDPGLSDGLPVRVQPWVIVNALRGPRTCFNLPLLAATLPAP